MLLAAAATGVLPARGIAAEQLERGGDRIAVPAIGEGLCAHALGEEDLKRRLAGPRALVEAHGGGVGTARAGR